MNKQALWKRLLVSAGAPIFLVALFLLLFFICQHDCWLTARAASDSPDAIGIRVMPNSDHYSPLSWYYKNLENKGSPQALIVDGYEAVRDGRSVYINAANIKYGDKTGGQVTGQDENKNHLYTNIYILSYNQAAEETTKDIFGQIIKYFKFNINLVEDTGPGQCQPAPAQRCIVDKDCSEKQYCDLTGQCQQNCLLDSDCPDGQHCFSAKSRLVRDVKRLSDFAESNLAFAAYKGKNGKYPALPDGSYLPNRTISVWPSWHDTLSKTLGLKLPIDPVNKLGPCSGFDPITCWNETKKLFATNFENPVLPLDSLAYVYEYDPDSNRYKFCTNFETNYPELPAIHRCDAWISEIEDIKPEIFVGNCIRPEGVFNKCFISAFGQYPIDWSKTEIEYTDPAGWPGWTWNPGFSGLQLGNLSWENFKELKAKDVSLPSGRTYGIFRYIITIYDVQGHSNQGEGAIKICQLRTCAGIECGKIDDRCGGTLMCGECTSGKCVNNQCQK